MVWLGCHSSAFPSQPHNSKKMSILQQYKAAVPTVTMAQVQPVLPQKVCWLASSHHWVPAAPNACWTLNKQKLSIGSQCLFRNNLTTYFSAMGNSLHILRYFQLLLKIRFSGSWKPGDSFPTTFHQASCSVQKESRGAQMSMMIAPLYTDLS